jgi:hypothetical protein
VTELSKIVIGIADQVEADPIEVVQAEADPIEVVQVEADPIEVIQNEGIQIVAVAMVEILVVHDPIEGPLEDLQAIGMAITTETEDL